MRRSELHTYPGGEYNAGKTIRFRDDTTVLDGRPIFKAFMSSDSSVSKTTVAAGPKKPFDYRIPVTRRTGRGV